MMVTFVSQCEKKALNRTRRVLDSFANRIGDNTWQTVITNEGLSAVKKLLRKTASKNTAVSCHWIPVQKAGMFQHISLKALLTRDEHWQTSLPRDDMEMACLQLLVSLTQVLFIPEDKAELQTRICQPLSESDYSVAIEGKLDWSELDHPQTPFMQVRGVKEVGLCTGWYGS